MELEGAGAVAFAIGADATAPEATVADVLLGASALDVRDLELGATEAAPEAAVVECVDDDDDAGTVLAFFTFSDCCCVMVWRAGVGPGAGAVFDKAAMYSAVSFAVVDFLALIFTLFLLS